MSHFLVRNLNEEEISSLVSKGIWKENCPVAIRNLRIIELTHFDFDLIERQGKIMVLDQVAENVRLIFAEIFALKFKIHSVKLIDEFDGDDDLSMEANNSSAFNFRKIVASSEISEHSYGTAIDINPLQNPYFNPEKKLCLPKNSEKFLDRSKILEGMVEPIVPIFQKHGFTNWLGNRMEKPDYQHFGFKK